MLVLYKRVKTKHREFVYRSKCFYYNPSNSKKSRGVRIARTEEGKKKRNERQAYLKKKHDIYENFDIGDYWITLTYKDRTEPEEADRILSGVMAKLQKKLKRKGIPFVWYKTTEAGNTQRAHHHLLIRKTDSKIAGLLLEYWNTYGHIRDIQEITDMTSGRLVKYFLDGGEHKNLNYKTFGHSRNLRKPEVITRITPMKEIRENPKPPKCDEDGYRYEILRDTVKNWFPDIDGFTYQEYEMIKVKEVMRE